MGMTYTKVKATAPQEMQLNAGLLLSEFDPETGVLDATKILGATTGGVNFQATPSYIDFADGIDNAKSNTKEFKEIDSVDVHLTGTFLSITASLAKMLAGSADVSNVTSQTHNVKKVTPRATLADADFDDVWFVGDYGRGGLGFVAIHLLNGLNVGGFQVQSTDKGKGQFALDILGHYSINDQDTIPYEIYIGTLKD